MVLFVMCVEYGLCLHLLHPASHFSALQVVGKIASIEVPENLWPNVIEYLCQNINTNSDDVKEASFQALGFVCEEVR